MSKAQIRLAEVLRMKEKLMSNANLRNIVYESLDTQAKMVDGLKKVEVSTMIDQAQQLEAQIIPAIIKKHGSESPEFRFWKSVLDTIIFCMYLVDGYDIQTKRLIRTQHMLAYYQNHNEEMQQELNTYTTLERFITIDMLKKSIESENQQPPHTHGS